MASHGLGLTLILGPLLTHLVWSYPAPVMIAHRFRFVVLATNNAMNEEEHRSTQEPCFRLATLDRP